MHEKQVNNRAWICNNLDVSEGKFIVYSRIVLQESEVTNINLVSAEAKMILAELHAHRKEMASMRQEVHATLVAIRDVIAELRRVERTESNIEQELEDASQRLGNVLDGPPQPSLTSCSVCGSHVERHTGFADRRTSGDRRTPGLAEFPHPRNKQGPSTLRQSLVFERIYGGSAGTRTRDLSIKSRLLYQLSYGP
jgi:hypothetical protein